MFTLDKQQCKCVSDCKCLPYFVLDEKNVIVYATEKVLVISSLVPSSGSVFVT